jgi:uncharacterized tellurite resistance protein B-like protein
MFVDRLDTKQQGVLLTLAAQLIEADENIADQETQLLNTLCSQMSAEAKPVPVSNGELSNLFPSNPARAALLLELLGLAHADADYHLTEKDYISNVASSLGISELVLADMESWVSRQFALVREAEQFLEE